MLHECAGNLLYPVLASLGGSSCRRHKRIKFRKMKSKIDEAEASEAVADIAFAYKRIKV